jgi:Domain of unknown function (DUF4440)
MRMFITPLLCAILCLFSGPRLFAQTDEEIAANVGALDNQFWQAYNACKTADMRRFFTDDVEFYHDKGGITLGAAALVSSIETNICGGRMRVRREAVEGSVHVFPLHRDGVAYGAIVSGDHRFYGREADRPEVLNGVAKFTSLYLLKDGTWKMARVLSYDHQAAPYVSSRKSVAVPTGVLQSLAGVYVMQHGQATVRPDQDTLVFAIDGKDFTLYPESERVFFTKDRDVTFEFGRRGDGRQTLTVRERGAVADDGVSEK